MLNRYWFFYLLGGLLIAVIFFQTASSSTSLPQDTTSTVGDTGGNIVVLDEPEVSTTKGVSENTSTLSNGSSQEEPVETGKNELSSQTHTAENLELAGIVPASQDHEDIGHEDGPVVSQAKALLDLITKTVTGNQTPWLHLIWESQHLNAKTDAGTMPENGQLVQVGPISDIWVQINKNGYVDASVYIMRDSNGNPVQITNYRDGVGNNLTLGITSTDGPRHFDQALMSFITATEADVEKLVQISEEIYKDHSLIFFSGSTQYSEATYFEDLQITAIATEWRQGYDPITGLRMVSEYIAITSSGERIVYDKGEITFFEWLTEPPADVLQVLAQEVAK
jgi:hypothetical protein